MRINGDVLIADDDIPDVEVSVEVVVDGEVDDVSVVEVCVEPDASELLTLTVDVDDVSAVLVRDVDVCDEGVVVAVVSDVEEDSVVLVV